MAYPSVLTTYTDPVPTDRLSTTPHSSIESAQNTGLREIQAFIGTESSVIGTLMYDIRGAGSNGGGHVQTANKGGTGQTAFTKGDILVATSSSVITKLAVSANDNDFLAVNSSVAAGVNWTPGVTSGQIQNMAFQNATDTGTGSVYSISPVPCVLGYSAGQIFTFQAKTANTIAAPALNVSSLVSKIIKNPDGTALLVGQIAASAMTMVQYQGNASVFHLLSAKTSPVSFGDTRTNPAASVGGYTNLRAISTAVSSTKSASYVKLKELSINHAGSYNVGFSLKALGGDNSVLGRIYINASAVGIEQNESAGVFKDFVETQSVLSGDLLQIYGKTVATDPCQVKDFRVMSSLEDAGTWNTETV